MKNVRYLSLIALMSAVLFSAPNAAGQDIPVDIPDAPGESPADRERQKRQEQYHAALSRFFGTTSVTASPVITGSGLFFDTVVEGGVEIGDGDALFLRVGARMPSQDADPSSGGSFSNLEDAGGEIVALGYELGLGRFSSNDVIGRSTVSFSAGSFLGEVKMLYLEVSPRYIIRAGRYWSFPLGVQITTSFLGANADPVATIGLTAGLRRHFGRRESLK